MSYTQNGQAPLLKRMLELVIFLKFNIALLNTISALLISKCLIKAHFNIYGLSCVCCWEGLSVVTAENRWLWPLSDR